MVNLYKLSSPLVSFGLYSAIVGFTWVYQETSVYLDIVPAIIYSNMDLCKKQI